MERMGLLPISYGDLVDWSGFDPKAGGIVFCYLEIIDLHSSCRD